MSWPAGQGQIGVQSWTIYLFPKTLRRRHPRPICVLPQGRKWLTVFERIVEEDSSWGPSLQIDLNRFRCIELVGTRAWSMTLVDVTDDSYANYRMIGRTIYLLREGTWVLVDHVVLIYEREFPWKVFRIL